MSPSCLRLFVAVFVAGALAAPVQHAEAQTAFINEIHTDDQSGGRVDYEPDGVDDAYSDLEFVEFALETESGTAFDHRDVVAVFYDGSGAYAGYAIGPSLWERGETQGDYTLFSYGPFGVPLDAEGTGRDISEGALPDGAGAVALAWFDGERLHLIDLVSYGGPVTLVDDRWFGTVEATPTGVSESPAPTSDVTGLRVYALGLAGTLAPEDAPAGSGDAVRSKSTFTSRTLRSPDALLQRAAHGRTPRSKLTDTLHDKADAPPVASSAPPSLRWTVFANTGSPGRVNGNQALPVELSSFAATAEGETAVLTWTTASETGNAGFAVEHAHRTQPFEDVGFVDGSGTTSQPTTYRYRTSPLPPGRHTFRLRQVDLDGAFVYSTSRTVRIASPSTLFLSPPTPHPATATSDLVLTVDVAMDVDVALYDALGRRLQTLLTVQATPGAVHRIRLPARALSPGVYFIRARSSAHRMTRKVVVAR